MIASPTIQQLAKTIEETCAPRRQVPGQPTGWGLVDQALAEDGIPRGVLHEWFGDPDEPPSRPPHWVPPLSVMIHLAGQAASNPGIPHSWPIVWIGRRCWPYPVALPEAVLERSIFIDAPDLAERAWAIDVTLRCPAIAAVVADGSGLNMAATRRLQLGAGEGGSLAFLLRPPHELRQLSAAHTRWTVSPAPSATRYTRWTVRLLRCKGMRPSQESTWTIQLNHETGALDLVPHALDRSGAAEAEAAAVRTA